MQDHPNRRPLRIANVCGVWPAILAKENFPMSISPAFLTATASAIPAVANSIGDVTQTVGQHFLDLFQQDGATESNSASVKNGAQIQEQNESNEATNSWTDQLKKWIDRFRQSTKEAGFKNSDATVEVSREGNISVESSDKVFEDWANEWLFNSPTQADSLRQIQQVRSEQTQFSTTGIIDILPLKFDVSAT